MRLTIFRTLTVFAVLFGLAGLGVGCSGGSDSSAAPANSANDAPVVTASPWPEATATPTPEFLAEQAKEQRIKAYAEILRRPYPLDWEMKMRGENAWCDTLERGEAAIALVLEEHSGVLVAGIDDQLLAAAKVAAELLHHPPADTWNRCKIRDRSRSLDDAGYMYQVIHDALKAAESEPSDIKETPDGLRKALIDRVRGALADKSSHDEVPAWVEEALVSWPIAPRDIGISAEKLAELIPGNH